MRKGTFTEAAGARFGSTGSPQGYVGANPTERSQSRCGSSATSPTRGEWWKWRSTLTRAATATAIIHLPLRGIADK